MSLGIDIYIHICTVGFYGNAVEWLTATREISVKKNIFRPDLDGDRTRISTLLIRGPQGRLVLPTVFYPRKIKTLLTYWGVAIKAGLNSKAVQVCIYIYISIPCDIKMKS